jgi:hypothetical protein
MTAEEFRCHLIRTYLNTKKERRPVRGGRASSVPFGGNNVMDNMMEGGPITIEQHSAVSAIIKIVSSYQPDKDNLSIAATHRGLIWVPGYSSGSSTRALRRGRPFQTGGLGGLTFVPPKKRPQEASPEAALSKARLP